MIIMKYLQNAASKWCRTHRPKLKNLESFKRLLPACTTCFEFLRVQAKSPRLSLQVCDIVQFSVVLSFFLSVLYCFMRFYLYCLSWLKRYRSEAVSKPAPSRSTRKRQMRSASGTDSSSRTPRHRMHEVGLNWWNLGIETFLFHSVRF